jgi:hypothetical protein
VDEGFHKDCGKPDIAGTVHLLPPALGLTYRVIHVPLGGFIVAVEASSELVVFTSEGTIGRGRISLHISASSGI